MNKQKRDSVVDLVPQDSKRTHELNAIDNSEKENDVKKRLCNQVIVLDDDLAVCGASKRLCQKNGAEPHQFFLSASQRKEKKMQEDTRRLQEASKELRAKTESRNREFRNILENAGRESADESGLLFFDRKLKPLPKAANSRTRTINAFDMLEAPYPTLKTTNSAWNRTPLAENKNMLLKCATNFETLECNVPFRFELREHFQGEHQRKTELVSRSDTEYVDSLFFEMFGKRRPAFDAASFTIFESAKESFRVIVEWLNEWKAAPVSESKPSGGPKKRGRKRKSDSGCRALSYSEESEQLLDELQSLLRKPGEANSLLLQNAWAQMCLVNAPMLERNDVTVRQGSHLLLKGASGSGKTSLVHHAAKQCGYYVFQINEFMQRGARELNALLKEAASTLLVNVEAPCLFLVDDVDVAFRADKGLWLALVDLMNQSRRPIIFTGESNPFSRTNKSYFAGACPGVEVLDLVPPSSSELSERMFLSLLDLGYLCPSKAQLDKFVNFWDRDWRQISAQTQFWFSQRQTEFLTVVDLERFCVADRDISTAEVAHRNHACISGHVNGDFASVDSTSQLAALKAIAERCDSDSMLLAKPFYNPLLEFRLYEADWFGDEKSNDLPALKHISKTDVESSMHDFGKCKVHCVFGEWDEPAGEADELLTANYLAGGHDSFMSEAFSNSFSYCDINQLNDNNQLNDETVVTHLRRVHKLLLCNYELGLCVARVGSALSPLFTSELLPFIQFMISTNSESIRKKPQVAFSSWNHSDSSKMLTRRRRGDLSITKLHFPSLSSNERDFIVSST